MWQKRIGEGYLGRCIGMPTIVNALTIVQIQQFNSNSLLKSRLELGQLKLLKNIAFCISGNSIFIFLIFSLLMNILYESISQYDRLIQNAFYIIFNVN